MALSVAEQRTSVLVDMVFNVNDKTPLPATRLLRVWLEELAKWPDLPPRQALIFVLRFSWTDESRSPSFFSWFSRGHGEKVADLVKHLAAAPISDRLGLVALDPLRGIGEDEVFEWIRVHAAPLLRETHGKQATALEENLRGRVESFFKNRFKEGDVKTLPMHDLAPALRQHLLECLQGGGT